MRGTRFLPVLVLAVLGSKTSAVEETLEAGSFGTVHLYHRTPQPANVVLFVSGDGGWNLGVVDMARELAALEALVVGIDITHYLPEMERGGTACSYPAADFETLSKIVQKKLDYGRYVRPLLVGYSSGATLVYATLVQAPSTTFRGAISLGFCPDLPLTKPLCKGSGLESTPGPKGKGLSFLPAPHLEVPWIALQGGIDQVCDAAATERYVSQVHGARIVPLPNVGHGYSVPRNWLPQFKAAFTSLVQAPDTNEPPPPQAEAVRDLPVIEVPATGAADPSGGSREASGALLAFLATGDGGYGVTDQGIARSLAEHGIPVVVLNSLHYFWKARTPEETAADVERILRHYLTTWRKEKVLFIGYSFGADILPVVLNRLPQDLRERARALALLGVSETAEFQFHLGDWLGHRETGVAVRPELEKLRGLRILCFYGTEDREALCQSLDSALVHSIPIKGGHRFGSNYGGVVEAILHEAR